MTNRWINVVLAVVVVLGLTAVAIHERPRTAQERADFVGQDVAQGIEDPPDPPEDRDGPVIERREDPELEDQAVLAEHGVTASDPLAVDVGMEVLEAGGNAVDAAVAVAFALGVAEPFGSGPGGGGSMLVHAPGEDPVGYDYREVAPLSGEVPASDIGVPGFVAGLERVHAEHGSMEFPNLIEPAARLAEDGYEVSEYLHERLAGAAYRLPIHQLPRLFPNGQPIEVGERLVQPEYATALRAIQEEGADAIYGGGELGQLMADAVDGWGVEDLQAYEVLEIQPAVGSFSGFEVIGAGPPVSGPTVVEQLQVAEALDIGDRELGSVEYIHALAQSYRVSLSDRTQYISDPSVEDVPIDQLLDPEYAREVAAGIPDDAFVAADDIAHPGLSPESDTTHFVVVDRSGTMVSGTNTLSNFFGSGLAVSGFFLNDQLKNFSTSADSINQASPGKRPRSFIAPMIVADDGAPVLGIGSPGGRRIPMVVAQVIVRWAAHGESIEEASTAPRFHLEGHDLYSEVDLDGPTVERLLDLGYEIYYDEPTTEFYGGIQALMVDQESGTLTGVADERRDGSWAAAPVDD